MIARPWPRPLAAVLKSLPALALVALALPGPVAGGEGKRPARSSTIWSGSSSGKTVRTDWRDGAVGGYHQSTTTSDREPWDGPAEVDAYFLSRDGGHWRTSRGTRGDWCEAEAAIERTGADCFWFRRGDESYLVTDSGAIRELAELFAPQEELGRRQGELGRRQGDLGRLQGELGRKQGEIGRIQARLGRLQAAVAARRVSYDRTGRGVDAFERESEEISQGQLEAGELQSELGRQQSALGERQSALGEKQAELGRDQERVSKQVTVALGGLTRELITDGRARRITR